MKSERYSKFLTSLVTILALFSLVISPALAAAGDNSRPPLTFDEMQSNNESRQLSISTALSSSPVMFIENVGQVGDSARFQVRGNNSTIWLSEDALWITVQEKPSPSDPSSPKTSEGMDSLASLTEKDVVMHAGDPRKGVNIKLSYPGANPHPSLEAFNRLETQVSYFLGNDPAKWRADVPIWGGVRYKDLYPGIDLEISGENGQLVQRLVAHAGANIDAVRLRVDGADGMELLPDPDGKGAGDQVLRLKTAIGAYTLPLLQLSGAGSAKPSKPAVTGSQVTSPFAAPSGETAKAIRQTGVSDLLYGTYLGGSDYDEGHGIAVDSSGAAYITGYTLSSDFPTTPGAFDTSFNGDGGEHDVFVVKLNAAGSALTYATFLGGGNFGGEDYGYGIAVDASGAAYVTGYTYSSDFPTTPGALVTFSYQGGFVVKLNPAGSALTYATYLEATISNYSSGLGIAVDSSGAAYVTGRASSSGFPTTPGAFDTSFNGMSDVFVLKLNPAGSALDYATFLGGSGNDYGYGIAVDSSGAAYITGDTLSSGFPTTSGAFDTSFNGDGGEEDVFVVKLNAAGSALTYATFLGGSDHDWGKGIAVDSSGATYVTGYTYSSDFPTTSGAFDTNYNGGYTDAFVMKLNPAGSALAYATYLGGYISDLGSGVAVDSSGAAYVTGWTSSSDFPTTPGAFQPGSNGFDDVFVVKLNPAGSALDYATFLGGEYFNAGYGITVDSNGAAYVTGWTSSSDFPTTSGAFDTSHNGGNYDAFVVKLLPIGAPTVTAITRLDANPTSAASLNFTVTFSEPVKDVSKSDFSLTKTGAISGESATGVSGGPTIYTVSANTGSGNGTLRLDVPVSATINDLVGNPLDGLPFTSGEAYDILKDSSGFNPWYGSVSITADKNVVAVGRPHIGSDEVASYSGFSAGALTAYVPMLFKNAYDGGAYDSALYIQNVDAYVTANVAIKYYDSSTGALTCTDTDTIKPLASKGYWLPTLSATECLPAGLPVGWVGSAVVTSSTTAKIVAIGRPHIGAEVMTYDSFSSGSLTSYLPMLFNGAWGSYDSAYYIQNVSPTVTAEVTIKYYDSASGLLTCSDTASILPNTSKGYWLPTAVCLYAASTTPALLPAGWVGGVVVTSSAAPIVSVGRPHIGSQITTYNGFAAGGLSSYVPMLFRKAYGGTYDSALYIQNVDAVDAAITIAYYDSAGALTCSDTDTIAPLSSKGYWLPTLSAAECTDGGLPDDWVGGVVVTSTSANIVAIGRPHIGAQVTTYNGFTSGNSNSYLPMLFKNMWGYNSAFYVQNTDAFDPATATVKFYDADGNLSCVRSDNIPALSTLGYWVPDVICAP